jgi:phosphate-selective porin OprO and OprP
MWSLMPAVVFAQPLTGPPLSENYAGNAAGSGGGGYGQAPSNQPVLASPAVNAPTQSATAQDTALPYTPPQNQPASASPLGQSPSPSEAELAKRVEALETYIRQMKTANAVEPIPPPKAGKADDKGATDTAASDVQDATQLEECVPKRIDTISRPTFTPTGRFYFDGVTYGDDPETKEFFNTDRDNEFGFRTFRIGGRGNIYENLFYTIEVDLRGTNSAITYKDIYMEQQELPLIGRLRAGHFKEPIGLEEFEADLYLNFMEKTPATQAFDPSRNFGVMAWDTTDDCQDMSWFAGIFRADSPDSPTNTGLWRSDNNDWCVDTRLAWLPYYDEPSNGRYLVHLGGSYSYRHVGALTPTATYNQNVAYSTLNGLAEFSTRSWVGSQGPIGFGAEADSNQWNQLDTEFLVIWGAMSFQSEYFQLLMNSGEQYNGGYAFLSYFLTGENRSYRKDLKVVDRTQPFEPFFLVDSCAGTSCGLGAWEVAMGYSWVDLNDGHDTVATTPATAANRRRGFNNAFILGLNWYQNAWSRMYFDYELELVNFVDPGVPNSTANTFGVRWQVDW